MKLFRTFCLSMAFLCLFACFCTSVKAEEYQTIVGAGMSYNQYNSDNPVDGNLLFANKIGAGTYNFNLADVITLTRKPYTIALSFTPGLARRLMTFNVGVMTGGTTNVGYSFSSGMTGVIGLGKGFMAMPNFRVLKGSLVDTQYIFGMLFSWGSK
jgi:hypothetical protein